MKNHWQTVSFIGLALLLLANLLSWPLRSYAQSGGVALAPAQAQGEVSACWVAVGNKLYYVEKDKSTILKVKASGSL